MKVHRRISVIVFWLLVAAAGLAPFHAFLITWAKHAAGLSLGVLQALSMWREILTVLLLILLVPSAIFSPREFFRFKTWEWPVLGFILLCGIFLAVQETPAEQWLLGFRYDALFLIVAMMTARLALSLKELRTMLAVFFGAAFAVLIFGIFHALFLPQEFLVSFGYSINRDIWDTKAAISACQFLEHTKILCRATSFFGGPTRYGTYVLMILAFLPVLKNFLPKTPRARAFLWAFAGLAVMNLFLTFSRSAWIGGIAMLAVYGALFLHERKVFSGRLKRVLAGIFSAILLCGVFFILLPNPLLPNPLVKTIFLRGDSTSEHFTLMKEGFEFALQNPLGIGLGTVGPASLRFPTDVRERFITENWYLQIAIETGWLGLLLFMGALVALMRELVRERSALGRACFLALSSLLALSFFTHGFEETSTVLVLFMFCGIAVSSVSPQKTGAIP